LNVIMKKGLLITIFLASLSLGYSRDKQEEFLPVINGTGEFTLLSDSAAPKKAQKAAVKPKTLPKDSVKCLEKNCKNKKQCLKGKKDKFVDKDGDGLNDNRCKGTGLQNCHRKGKKCGKK
jgi:hypothetical protein